MTAEPSPVPALPELGLLERAVNYTWVPLTAVPATDPHAPTPCAGWDLTDLLTHMDESLQTIEQAGRLPTLGLARASGTDGPPAVPDGPVALVLAIRDRACALLDSWTDNQGERLISVAGSPLHAGVLAAAGSLEITVHGVDLARACGMDHPLPEALAADLLAYLPLLVQPSDRPARFSPEVPVPEHAPASARLLASLGRQP